MSIGQLVLGTARFGLDGAYGFQAAKPDLATVEAIIGRAWDAGVRWLDTAEAYGDAEQRLGEIGVRKWRVVSKIAPNMWDDVSSYIQAPPDHVHDRMVDDIERHYVASGERLYNPPDCYLIHSSRYAHSAWILGVFLSVTERMGIKLRGVSCYTVGEAFDALRAGCTAIQVPHNLLDLRAWHAGVFVEAERRGATVFARSPFCQGLLTLAPADPRVPEPLRPRIQAVRDACQYANGPTAFALAGALLTADHVVFGCETVNQLEENLSTAMQPAARFQTLDGLHPDFLRFGGATDAVVNPSRFAAR